MQNNKLEFYNRKIINLDITNRCSLECPKCQRSYLKSKNKKVPGYDMPLRDYMMILQHFEQIDFCGQSSDPIFHPEFINFLELAYKKKTRVNVHTAASQKSKQWYKKAFETNIDAKWIFGIDGLPNTSYIHRVNQDSQKLFEVMMMAKNILKSVRWQYIVFNYNEHTIEEAHSMAKEAGVQFMLVNSSRWLGEHDPYRPSKEHSLSLHDG